MTTNITIHHFATATGKTLLSEDKDGFPQIAAGVTTGDEKDLAEIALAIYTHQAPLQSDKRNSRVVASWATQFNPSRSHNTAWTLEDVRAFAWKAHAEAPQKNGTIGQLRKYTGEPYIVHPMMVAGIVAGVPKATKQMVAAAMLHDVVEDTGVTAVSLEMRFDGEVARIVDGLSDMQTPADGNRAERKAREAARLAKADWAIQTVKLADLISNTLSIVWLDPKFARTYLVEKAQLLKIMNRGDPVLYELAWKLCHDGAAEIGLNLEEAMD